MKMERGINDAEGCVRKALGLIPLLISEAYYTKVFSGSWQVIAAQLELLNRTITSIIITTQSYHNAVDRSLKAPASPDQRNHQSLAPRSSSTVTQPSAYIIPCNSATAR